MVVFLTPGFLITELLRPTLENHDFDLVEELCLLVVRLTPQLCFLLGFLLTDFIG